MEYTGYPVIQFGSFRKNVQCQGASTQRSTPSTGTPRGYYSPRSPRRSPVKYNNIQEQLDFANSKYEEVLNKYMRTPCKYITEKQEEDVWAWGIFSEVVLPMLKIIDDE